MNRLYIGNLPYNVDEKQLLETFIGMGFRVSRPHVVKDRETNQSKGFGFLEAESPAHAQEIVQAADGTVLGNRPLRVSIANPRPERGSGGGGGYSGGGGGGGGYGGGGGKKWDGKRGGRRGEDEGGDDYGRKRY